MDLRKAFDTVDHDILVKKLQWYGIRDTNPQWCKNYLTSHNQRTLANGTISGSATIECGVPQGSVLGPFFFILYLYDVKLAVHNAHLQLYADDTVIHSVGVNAEAAAINLRPALRDFALWCHRNKLNQRRGVGNRRGSTADSANIICPWEIES